MLDPKQVRSLNDQNHETSKLLLDGIKEVAMLVGQTLGYRGRNVLIPKGYSDEPFATKDGFTVAKAINLSDEDPIKKVGSKLAKNVSRQMVELVGDGTTTVTILYYGICKSLSQYMFAGHDKVDLAAGGSEAKSDIIELLSQNIIHVEPDDQKLHDVATISSNSTEIGDKIAEIMKNIGRKGVINVQDGSIEDEYELVEGMIVSSGYKDTAYINNQAAETTEFDRAFVIVADKKLESILDIQKVVELIEKGVKDAPLLIIAQDVTGIFSEVLRVNSMAKRIKVCPVKVTKSEILDDIAIFVGATKISDQGVLIEDIALHHLGKVEKVAINKKSTVLLKGSGSQNAVNDRIEILEAQIKNKGQNQRNDIEELEKRIQGLTALVCNYKVGGSNEIAQKERRDRVEDAAKAVKAAIDYGIVPGGFSCYVRAQNKLLSKLNQLKTQYSLSYIAGYQAVLDALLDPIMQALSNAGQQNKSQVIIENIINSSKNNESCGFDLKTFEMKNNMIECGIADPAKVVTEAVSIAWEHAKTGFLLSNGVIANKPESNKSDHFNDAY